MLQIIIKARQLSWVMLLTYMLKHGHLARETLVLKTIKRILGKNTLQMSFFLIKKPRSFLLQYVEGLEVKTFYIL